MRYNRLTDTELERAVYIDPTNQAARTEQLARIPALLDERSDEQQDLEMQLENVTKEHATEVEALEEDLDAAALRAHRLRQELDQAHDRIAKLTNAKDLV